jgi:hypothetical protein
VPRASTAFAATVSIIPHPLIYREASPGPPLLQRLRPNGHLDVRHQYVNPNMLRERLGSITLRPIVMNYVGDGQSDIHDPYAAPHFPATLTPIAMSNLLGRPPRLAHRQRTETRQTTHALSSPSTL